ncbi:hypothetical protein BCR35DRAFT_306597 [Leucosporidium creatinivorum]|uniref:Snurportin-1 n=1 Tax=Leucosporidium creatinivorum TaxID=106004 RepID=A0A1Y2ETB2_9BASI|nr:hypothetical protein BCR35DRAFT_306597 [Leucosporidium creatinivorum]
MESTSPPPPHHIPARRLSSFHHGAPSPAEAQHARRAAALAAQRERRTHAFEAARALASSRLDVDGMGDLSLGSGGQFSDADSSDGEGDQRMDSPAPPPIASPSHSHKTPRSKPQYKPWARNLLTQGETLDLSHGLPKGLESDWMLRVVPKGKRCLCAVGTDSYGTNSVLYSRVSGRSLSRHSLPLPASTLLDVVYDSALGVLWVLDLIRWMGRDFVECDGGIRSFFLASKLSELGLQLYTPPSPSADGTTSTSTNGSAPLLLGCPTLSSPLLPSSLLPLLTSVPPTSAEPLPVAVTILSPSTTPSQPPSTSAIHIPLQAIGLMLYLTAAHYESGLTALAGWIPCEMGDKGKEGQEGVRRFGQLAEEWAGRGGPASGMME